MYPSTSLSEAIRIPCSNNISNKSPKVITKTFTPFLAPGQSVPKPLIQDLLTQFSTSAGYAIYPDVLPFFRMLQAKKKNKNKQSVNNSNPEDSWEWDNTVVGIITNSDSRVPDILQSFGLSVGPRRVGHTTDMKLSSPKVLNEDDDISFVVLSYDVGHEKPDRRIFDAAVEMLDVTLAEEASKVSVEDFEKLYVGDDVEKDYFGARGAGWDAVLLDRRLQEDNLKESPVARYEVPNEEGNITKEVDVLRDLGALSRWVPGGFRADG